MDWKKLVLVGGVAFLAGIVITLLAVFLSTPLFYPISIAGILMLELAAGAVFYKILKNSLKWDCGKGWMGILISSMKIWILVITFSIVVYYGITKPIGDSVCEKFYQDLRKQYEGTGTMPLVGCLVPLLLGPYGVLGVSFLTPANPLFFFPGAYLARRFLRW